MPSRAYVIPLTHGGPSVWGGCDDNPPQSSNNQQQQLLLLKALEALLFAGHAAHAGEDDGVKTPHPPSLQHNTITPPHIDSTPNAFYEVIKDKLPEILAMEWIKSTMVAAVYTQAMVHIGKCGAEEWRQACLALGIDFDRPPFQDLPTIDYLDTFGKMAFCISRDDCKVKWDELKKLQPGVLEMYHKMMDVREQRGISVDIEGIFTVEREAALLTSSAAPEVPPEVPPRVPPRVPRGSSVISQCDESQRVCRLRNIKNN